MEKKPENFENCNHHLSLHAIKTAVEMGQTFGNAAFSPNDAGYSTNDDRRSIRELLDQGFLVDSSRDKQSMVSRNMAIIGLPPQYRGHVEV